MKKLTHSILAISLLGSVLYSCSLLKALDEVQQNGFICSNYANAPINLMNKQEVKAMVSNYYHRQYQAINIGSNRVAFPNSMTDSRMVFFSLDTLKRLIYNIETYTRNLPETEKANLGVNVYFASYSDSQAHFNHGINYTNRHTLVFIPAYFNDADKAGKSFDPRFVENNGNKIEKALLTSADFNNPGTIMGTIARLSSTVSDANGAMFSQNNGTAMPPPPAGEALLDAAN